MQRLAKVRQWIASEKVSRAAYQLEIENGVNFLYILSENRYIGVPDTSKQ